MQENAKPLDKYDNLYKRIIQPFLDGLPELVKSNELITAYDLIYQYRSKVGELAVLSLLPIDYNETRDLKDPTRDRPINQIIEVDISHDLSKKSPDNCFVHNGTLYFFEVGVTVDINKMSGEKEQNYLALQGWLERECTKMGLKTKFSYIIFNENGGNIASCLNSVGDIINTYPEQELVNRVYEDFRIFHDKLEETKLNDYEQIEYRKFLNRPNKRDLRNYDVTWDMHGLLEAHNERFVDTMYQTVDGEKKVDFVPSDTFIDDLAKALKPLLENGTFDKKKDELVDPVKLEKQCTEMLNTKEYFKLKDDFITEKIKPSLHIAYFPYTMKRLEIPGISTEVCSIRNVLDHVKQLGSLSSDVLFVQEIGAMFESHDELGFLCGNDDKCFKLSVEEDGYLEKIEEQIKELGNKGYVNSLHSLIDRKQFYLENLNKKKQKSKGEQNDEIKIEGTNYLEDFKKLKLTNATSLPNFRDANSDLPGKMRFNVKDNEFTKKYQKKYDKKREKRIQTLVCDDKYYNSYDDFMNYLLTKGTDIPVNPEFTREPASEGSLNTHLKIQSMESYNHILGLLHQTKGVGLAKFYETLCNQIIFYGTHDENNKKYTLMTGGLPNHILVLAPGNNLSKQQDSRAFFQIFVVGKDEHPPSTIFGSKINVYETETNKIFITNWRRLEAFKFDHLKNVYSSIIGYSVTSLMRTPEWVDEDINLVHVNDLALNELKQKFSLPLIIACTTSLINCTLQADMRYIIINSTGLYANLGKFLESKFDPVYKCIADVFLVMTALKSVPILASNKDECFKKRIIKISREERLNESIGGDIEMASIYTDYVLKDFQDLLDMMYFSVLQTKISAAPIFRFMAEYSTLYEYECIYNKTNKDFIVGYNKENDHVKQALDLLMTDSKVGFSRQCIYDGIKYNTDLHDARNRIMRETSTINFKESIISLATLKVCVAGNSEEEDLLGEGELQDLRDGIKEEIMARFTADFKKKKQIRPQLTFDVYFNGLTGTLKTLYDRLVENNRYSRLLSDYMNETKKGENGYEKVSKKGAQFTKKHGFFANYEVGIKLPSDKKVKGFFGVLDLLVDSVDGVTIGDMINLFLTRENGPKFSTALKDQYGSKRVFFLQDFVTRFMTYVDENKIWKPICKCDNTECITKSGDDKMRDMDQLTTTIENEIKSNADQISKDGKVEYNYKNKEASVNGDCTKWSNSAVTQTYAAQAEAMHHYGLINEQAAMFTVARAAQWTKKRVTYHSSMLKNLTNKSLESDKNPYYKYSLAKTGNLTELPLASGFLQGMWNLPSSLVHSNLNIFFKKLLYSIYGWSEKDFKFIARLHSDDYFHLLFYKDDEQLVQYRVLYKLCQRLFGISDSEKKTVIHSYITEFVSLYGFNGLSSYPWIKVSKDIMSNLPCTGYLQDLAAVCSLSGRAVSKGFPTSSAYFIQRLGNTVLEEMYKLGKIIKVNRLELPCSAGGIFDVYPISLPFTGTSMNDLRILKYTKNGYKYLHALSPLGIGKFDGNTDDVLKTDLATNFYNFQYAFPRSSTVLELRRLYPLTNEQVKEFWDENPHYRYCKPAKGNDCTMYLKCMLYGRQSDQAFSNTSKASLLIRLGMFKSRSCIRIRDKLYKQEQAYKMLIDHLNESDPPEADRQFVHACCTNYSAIPDMFLNLSNDSVVYNTRHFKYNPRFKYVNSTADDTLGNINAGLFLFYKVKPAEFQKHYPDENILAYESYDKRLKNFIEESSWNKVTLERTLPLIYNLMVSMLPKRVGLYTGSRSGELLKTLKDMYTYNSFYGKEISILYGAQYPMLGTIKTGLLDISLPEVTLKAMHTAAQEIYYTFSVNGKLDKDRMMTVFTNLHPFDVNVNYLDILKCTTTDSMLSLKMDWVIIQNTAIMKGILFKDTRMMEEVLERHSGFKFTVLKKDGMPPITGAMETNYETILFMRHLNSKCLLYCRNKRHKDFAMDYLLYIDSKDSVSTSHLLVFKLLTYAGLIPEKGYDDNVENYRYGLPSNAGHLLTTIPGSRDKKCQLWYEADVVKDTHTLIIPKSKLVKKCLRAVHPMNTVQKELLRTIEIESDSDHIPCTVNCETLEVSRGIEKCYSWTKRVYKVTTGLVICDPVDFKVGDFKAEDYINMHCIYNYNSINSLRNSMSTYYDMLMSNIDETDGFKLFAYKYYNKDKGRNMDVFSWARNVIDEVDVIDTIKFNSMEWGNYEDTIKINSDYVMNKEVTFDVSDSESDAETFADEEPDARLVEYNKTKEAPVHKAGNIPFKIKKDREMGLKTKEHIAYASMITTHATGLDPISLIDAKLIFLQKVSEYDDLLDKKLDDKQKYMLWLLTTKWLYLPGVESYERNSFRGSVPPDWVARVQILVNTGSLTSRGQNIIDIILKTMLSEKGK